MEQLTVHHLVPRQHTKRKKIAVSDTIEICAACHKQIHALFDNKYLAKELNTLAKLKNDLQIQKFIAWVKKQNAHKRVIVRRKK